jgi:hypothetical protein
VYAEKLKSKRILNILTMKKTCLLIPLIAILLFQPATAQFEQGRVTASVMSTIGLGDFGTGPMSIGFTTQKNKYSNGDVDQNYKSFGFNLLPRGGYFVIDNLAVGADLLISVARQISSDSDYKETKSTLAIGPFARYYFPLENIYPFVEGNISFGQWKEKWTNGTDGEEKESLLIYGLGIGAGKSLGENLMIDALLGYSSRSWKNEDDVKYIYGTLGLRVGLTLLFSPGN